MKEKKEIKEEKRIKKEQKKREKETKKNIKPKLNAEERTRRLITIIIASILLLAMIIPSIIGIIQFLDE